MQNFRNLIFADGRFGYSENVHLGFYFADLIIVVCKSTAKTMKLDHSKISGYTVASLSIHLRVCY